VEDLELLKDTVREDSLKKHGAGIYWTAVQNGKVLFRDVKNIAVQYFYTLAALMLTNSNRSFEHGYVNNVITTGTNVITIDGVDSWGGSVYGMFLAAGTDTTTPTDPATMTSLVAQVGGGSNIADNQGFTIPLQFVLVFPSGTLGLVGTNTIAGELGLFVGAGVGASGLMISRIAVADGANLGNGAGNTVTINNSFAASFTCVIYL
jgi:hypothetical protein